MPRRDSSPGGRRGPQPAELRLHGVDENGWQGAVQEHDGLDAAEEGRDEDDPATVEVDLLIGIDRDPEERRLPLQSRTESGEQAVDVAG